MSYKLMTYDPIDTGWEDDSFASGWVANYCSLTRDGDIAKLKLDTGYAGGWIQKDGLNINALTYKYCVVSVKGTDRFFVEVYDGSWKLVTSGHETAPSEYDIKVYDLSGITTGTITNIRLGVGDVINKEAYYDFLAFCSVQPLFCTDKVLSLFVKQRETDVDEFEVTGTDDIGSGLSIGRHLRILLKGSLSGSAGELRKVFAGVIEENTPDDVSGKVLHITGRCFGQKLLLRTKSKNFNVREVSLAVKDFVADLTEITTYQVETPSPVVYITKEFPYEYIIDGLRDLAKQAGSDWEAKLGMGHDLRFRSRTSSNVPSVPISITEADGHILRSVRKETDGYRAYNKVTVLGGEMSNIDGDVDKYTDEGDKVTWNWQVFGEGAGSYVYEDYNHVAMGKVSMRSVFTYYSTSITTEFDLGSSGIDLALFKYIRFMHMSDGGISKSPPETNFYFRVRLRDTAYRNAVKTYLGTNIQPPQEFAEVILAFSDFTVDSGFDWQHVRWVQFQGITDRSTPGEGIGGYYSVDKVFFWTPNITKSATTTNDFRHTREYVHRDEKLLDPSFIQEVANALLNVLKNKENRFRLPLVGIPAVQVGHKVTVNSPTWGLNGTYYIVEAEHQLTRSGYVTEMILESPKLYLETLLAQVIERKIRLIERGKIS